MNAVKQIIEQAGLNQRKTCELMKINQSTLSHRMKHKIEGTIEMSIKIAKELNLHEYTIIEDGYTVTVKLKNY